MRIAALVVAVGAAFAFELRDAHPGGAAAADPTITRGRYLIRIGGCNDCHTPGYLAKEGRVPEDQWLIGDSLGFSGPWGTTYPTNLRRLLGTMDEEAWVRFASNIRTRPPMPWFNLRQMTENDLRAIYAYVRSLPASDARVPDYLPPGEQPSTPHIVMTPQGGGLKSPGSSVRHRQRQAPCRDPERQSGIP